MAHLMRGTGWRDKAAMGCHSSQIFLNLSFFGQLPPLNLLYVKEALDSAVEKCNTTLCISNLVMHPVLRFIRTPLVGNGVPSKPFVTIYSLIIQHLSILIPEVHSFVVFTLIVTLRYTLLVDVPTLVPYTFLS